MSISKSYYQLFDDNGIITYTRVYIMIAKKYNEVVSTLDNMGLECLVGEFVIGIDELDGSDDAFDIYNAIDDLDYKLDDVVKLSICFYVFRFINLP